MNRDITVLGWGNATFFVVEQSPSLQAISSLVGLDGMNGPT